MENDRVLGDLWGKSNVPMVLNNPYSEADQVRAHVLCCFGWEGALGDMTHPGGFSHHEEPARTTLKTFDPER